MANRFNISKVKRNFERMQREIPIVIAQVSKNHFVENFKKEAWNGDKWITPNRKIEGTKEYKYPKTKGLSRRTSPILVRSGALRRDVSNSIQNATWKSIRLVSNMPYSARHNYGLSGMPQRQFMGDSVQLRKKQKEVIKTKMNNIWH